MPQITGWQNAGVRSNVSTLNSDDKPAFDKGKTSQRAFDYDKDVRSSRPDALFRSVGNDIQIRTGGRVSRNRSLAGKFKRVFTGAFYQIGVKKLAPKKFSARALRHAEYERDKAVNKLVADIANGKFSAMTPGARKQQFAARMTQLDKLQGDVRAKLTANWAAGNHGVGSSKPHTEALANDQLSKAVQESLMAAFKAKPDQVERTYGQTMALFEDFVPADAAASGRADDDIDETKRMATQGGRYALAQFLDTSPAPTPRSGLLHTMANPRKQLSAEQLGDLADAVGKTALHLANKLPPDNLDRAGVRALAQHLSYHPEDAGKIVKQLGADKTHKLMSNLGKALGASDDDDTPLHDVRRHLVEGLASNLGVLKAISLKNPSSGYLGRANGLAPTLKGLDGRFVHSDAQINKHFQDMYDAELPDAPSKGYFRGSQATATLIPGMLDRYSDNRFSKLADKTDDMLRDLDAKARDYQPKAGLPTKTGLHPEVALQALRGAVGQVTSFQGSDKLHGFFDQAHKGFEGDPQNNDPLKREPLNRGLKGQGNRFLRTFPFLRSYSPNLTVTSARPDDSDQLRALRTRVSAVMTTIANEGMDKAGSQITRIGNDYVNAVKAEYRKEHGTSMPANDVAKLQRDILPTLVEIGQLAKAQMQRGSAMDNFYSHATGRSLSPDETPKLTFSFAGQNVEV